MSFNKNLCGEDKHIIFKKGMDTNSDIGKTEKNYLFLPVVLVMIVIPLIVHLTIVHLDFNEACLFGTTVSGDLFSQAKAMWLLIAGIIFIILFGVNYRKLVDCKIKLNT